MFLIRPYRIIDLKLMVRRWYTLERSFMEFPSSFPEKSEKLQRNLRHASFYKNDFYGSENNMPVEIRHFQQ